MSEAAIADINATSTESGETFVVARTAFVMALYGDSKLNRHGEAILDAWLQLLPPGTSIYWLGKTSRQYKEVTPATLTRIRRTLADVEQAGQFYALKDAGEFSVGRSALERNLGMKDDALTPNRFYCVLPFEFPTQGGADAVAQQFQRIVEQLPIRHATAGYGFDLVWGREWEQDALPVMIRAARRFLALDVRDRLLEGTLLNQMKGAGWLTFLTDELLESLGGRAEAESACGRSVDVIPISRGIILRAGEFPPIGDVNRRALDIEPLRCVNSFIMPLRAKRWLMSTLFRADTFDPNDWFSRLDK